MKLQTQIAHRRVPVGVYGCRVLETIRLNRLRDVSRDIDEVRILALDLLHAGAATKHTVQFLDQVVDGFIQVVCIR